MNKEFRRQAINQSIRYYFVVLPKVDHQRAGQLSLPHIGITKTEKNVTKTYKKDEQVSPVNGLEP